MQRSLALKPQRLQGSFKDKLDLHPRKVTGLKWARLKDKPASLSVGRKRGAKGQGLKYEARAISHLTALFPPGDLRYHLWIEYLDDNGLSWAEPEAVVIRPTELILFEVKLTGCQYGLEQMRDLYAPLLSSIFLRPVRGLQVCRAVCRSTPGPYIDSVDDFIEDGPQWATYHLPRT